MATASTMIIAALTMTGEKAPGGTLTTDEQAYHLDRLNAMLDSWSIDRLMVYQLLQESQALTASVGSFTIGSGGTWNTTRPTKIVPPCFVRDSGGIDYGLRVIDAISYGNITEKALDNSYPSVLFYDNAIASGLGTIYLWPEPMAGLTLYINSWKQLQQFALISDTVVLPPGYQHAIETNYAVFSTTAFSNVSPVLVAEARRSKAALMAFNAPRGTLKMDVGIVRSSSSNILSNGL